MGFPIRICFPCEECGIYTAHFAVGEHGPYVVYECEECGKRHLVHKAIAFMFTDFTKCGQPIT